MAWAFVVLVVVIALVGYLLLRRLDKEGTHEPEADERATTVIYDESDEAADGTAKPSTREEQRQ